MASKQVFVVAAKRTAFGAFGGKLVGMTATDLAAHSAKAALASANIDPKLINSVIIGNVAQTSTDAAYIARHVGLRAGVPIEVPALTVNRLCGSGFQSIVSGVHEILLGESEVVLTGGAESMSQAPFAARNIRFGVKFGTTPELEDTLWGALTDQHIKTPMGITAENLAEQYNITREECDKFAISSQTRWSKANQSGVFKDEIAPLELKGKKGMEVFDTDEHPRPNTTLEALAKLAPVFKKNGTVTAGNASGISDGASTVIIASEDAVKKYNLTPLARVVGYQVAGVDPSVMGIGPVPAIRGVLKKVNLGLKDIDVVEVNEAFAPQTLAVMKELGLDPEKTNINGGAISLGHPLGASGSRIIANLVYTLRQKNLKYAIGSACIGGGQGIAIVLERA